MQNNGLLVRMRSGRNTTGGGGDDVVGIALGLLPNSTDRWSAYGRFGALCPQAVSRDH